MTISPETFATFFFMVIVVIVVGGLAYKEGGKDAERRLRESIEAGADPHALLGMDERHEKG